MKACRGCGLEVPDEARICPKCGYQFRIVSGEDEPAAGRWLVLAAFLAIAALTAFVIAISASQ